MINNKLLKPKSIVVVGGSDDMNKPGGAVLRNLINSNFEGSIYVVNPKSEIVQGIKCHQTVEELPQVDCAIIAIAAKFCVQTVEILAKQKQTGGFVILSAGFSEENKEGAELERKIVEIINSVNASLIGPNCTGMLTTHFNGAFTSPIPKLDPQGVDFISGSGATAIFIVDNGIRKGIKFNSVFAVGNSAQLGVEELLEYFDETYVEGKSSKIKLLYIESISKPKKFLKHSSSLIQKGCRIAAIKSGSSEAGSRAASSHTGALASSDVAVEALFKKAGIVRCNGRDELMTVAAIFSYPELKGKNIAIITHAGGPAVMLTDALSNGGLEIPHIEGTKAQELLLKLFGGSSVGNPIDILATGTAEQLNFCLDACNNDFENIDGICVIWGSPGLAPVYEPYRTLLKKFETTKKPIFPIFPSYLFVEDEVKEFLQSGRSFFQDETLFGNALTKVFNTKVTAHSNIQIADIDEIKIRKIIDNSENGYLAPEKIHEIFEAAKIPMSKEGVTDNEEDCVKMAKEFGFPLVMKVVGPVHKSDVGGVSLNINDEEVIRSEFKRMIKIKDTYAILLAEQLSGTEIFIGAKRDDKFGHLILFGLGGIFIEIFKDVKACLAPISTTEAKPMIKELKSYKIIQGIRGKEGVNEEIFAELISRVSALIAVAPEIFEMDINPLLGNTSYIKAVDARIRVVKN
ncbi:MAG: acetate--CoA ligase family protein [Bacteroidales bacterium]|jgi:acetyltransferase|nr:acetate--CoA ligase family protein [Bacteroidales bacterium]